MNFTSFLYRTARTLRWINAAQRGKLPQRIVRVAIMRKVNGLINRSIR